MPSSMGRRYINEYTEDRLRDMAEDIESRHLERHG